MAVADHIDWARERVGGILAHGSTERVIAVLIGSIDGVAAVDGRSVGLTSDADRALLRAWREAAEALLVGTRTLTAELYAGSIVPADSRRRRVARGLAPVAPILTIDRSGNLDLDVALRGADPPPLIVYVRAGHSRIDHRASWVELPALTLTDVIRDARARLHARVIVAEGGPRLLAAALDEGVVTDLSLTTAPILLGSGPRLWGDDFEREPRTELLPAETIDGYVFAHYSIPSQHAPVSAGGHP